MKYSLTFETKQDMEDALDTIRVRKENEHFRKRVLELESAADNIKYREEQADARYVSARQAEDKVSFEMNHLKAELRNANKRIEEEAKNAEIIPKLQKHRDSLNKFCGVLFVVVIVELIIIFKLLAR